MFYATPARSNNLMRWTPSELAAYEARNLPKDKPAGGCDDESELHQSIATECNRRGWLCFRGSMAHRTHRTPGEPDFIILADSGLVYFIECKTRTGKLSNEQLGVAAMALKLGHTIHVVRSLEQFNELLTNR